MVVSERLSADERRDQILQAAQLEFAQSGLGLSTEEVARRAGISQPYVFRLFGTKRELMKAVVARCFRETLEVFQRAAEGKRGEEALKAMGEAYRGLLEDRTRLRAQMQAYAACDDPDVREAMTTGYGRLHLFVETVSGLDQETVANWFAHGMLLNVVAAMDLWGTREPWARRLIEGCIGVEKAAALSSADA